MNREVPSLIRWLLDGSGVADSNVALVGDLYEEYGCWGRSRAWLWRQTLVAVVGAALRDIRRHKLLSLRAIAVGLCVVIPIRALREQFAAHGVGDDLSEFWLSHFVAFALAGWMIAQTHRGHGLPMVLAFVGYSLGAKGWLVATHFHHFWNLSRPQEGLRDIVLMGMCLMLCVVSGVTASRQAATTSGGLQL